MTTDYDERSFVARSRELTCIRGLDIVDRLLNEGKEEEAIEFARLLKADNVVPAIPAMDTDESIKRWHATAARLFQIMKKLGIIRG